MRNPRTSSSPLPAWLTSLKREHSWKLIELQMPLEDDVLSTGIIFTGKALQYVTVFVSRKGHFLSFIAAPLLPRLSVSRAHPENIFHACPARGFAAAMSPNMR